MNTENIAQGCAEHEAEAEILRKRAKEEREREREKIQRAIAQKAAKSRKNKNWRV